MAQVMNAADSVFGSQAECFFTFEGRRFNFCHLNDFEAEYSTKIEDVPLLGSVNKGHKPVGGSGTWKATAKYVFSGMRRFMKIYQDTGRMPYLEIQVSNEDGTSSVGRQTTILKNCLLDKIIVAKFDTGETTLTEELSGTYERFELPEEFNDLQQM